MQGLRHVVVIALAAAAVGVGGCGTSDADNAKGTVKSFLNDVAAGNGGAACAKLTPQAQQVLSRAVQNMPCARALDALGAATSKSIRSRVKTIEPKITISGSRGTARYGSVTGSRSTRVLQLQKVGGSWKIASLPGG